MCTVETKEELCEMLKHVLFYNSKIMPIYSSYNKVLELSQYKHKPKEFISSLIIKSSATCTQFSMTSLFVKTS